MELERMLDHFDEQTREALGSIPAEALSSKGFDNIGNAEPVNVEQDGRMIGEDSHSAQIYLVEYVIPRFKGLRLVPGKDANGATEVLRAPVLIRPHVIKIKDADLATGEPAKYTPPTPRIVGMLTPSSEILRYASGQISNVTRTVSVRNALSTRYLGSDMLLVFQPSASGKSEPDLTLTPVWEALTGGLPAYNIPTAETVGAHNQRFTQSIEGAVKRFPAYTAGFDIPRFE